MFSTNLIQSNYGDLNIKSLAFDSFKERLQSTMTALTFFISTGQCDCDEIAESNFNYMIAYMSNINYDASKPERQHLVLIHICRTMLNIE
ncbi:hypothetical protein BANRA_01568 [Escherichia coli]|nr:hypothetical protein BANRA_01568 [Escherichia coli]